METLTANLGTAKTRRASLNGREHLVVPLRMIVPGVLPGSQGPLLYLPEENARNPEAWNGVPILLGHPQESGEHVSGRTPAILDGFGLGTVFEAKVSNDGMLDAEGWFDLSKIKTVDSQHKTQIANLLQLIERGETVDLEISTGLHLDIDETPGTHNGKPYAALARNYRPDHLAVLLDSRGACSVDDGCGVIRNEGEGIPAQSEKIKAAKCECGKQDCEECGETYNAGNPKSTATGKYKPYGAGTGKGDAHESAQRGAMVLTAEDHARGADAKADAEAGHNPAGWAVDEDVWERAKDAADKGDYDGDSYYAVVAHIYQRMGGTVGGGTVGGGKTENELQLVANQRSDAMATPNRTDNVTFICANCSCYKGKEKLLQNKDIFSDEDVANIRKEVEASAAAKKGVKVGKRQYAFNEATLTFNAFPPAKDEEEAPGAEEEDEEEEEEDMMENKKPAANKRWRTTEEFLADQTLPSEVLESVTHGVKLLRNERKKVLQKLTANMANDEDRKDFVREFGKEPLARLEKMLKARGREAHNNDETPRGFPTFNDYGGLGGAAGADYADNELEVLDLEADRQNYDFLKTKTA